MPLTRSDFLKLLAGLGISLGAVPGLATVEATPPAATAGSADDFLRAVLAGDADRVRAALAADPALAGSKDDHGRSAYVLAWLSAHPEIAALLRPHLAALDLVEAVLADDGERVRALLDASPELLDQVHPIGGRPLHVAARFGRPKMVFGLIAGDKSALDADGKTALRLAAEFPTLAVAEEMAEALASNRADPNLAPPDGVTPLHVAAATGNAELARVLILNGARADLRDRDGLTALERARRAGRSEAAALLERAATLPRNHRTSRFAYTADGGRYAAPLVAPDGPAVPSRVVQQYVGISHGSLEKARELLDRHPGLLLAEAPWGELAVEAGAHVGYRELVQYQLDHGAPCSLTTAAMMGRAAFVRRLLAEDRQRIWDHGAHNFPPLWFAAVGGSRPEGRPAQLEVAQVLLDAGADVDSHKRGRTALHYAAQTGQVEMVELLAARGADLQAKTRGPEAETPLAAAQKAGQEMAAAALRRHGAR
jgi:ankyrin repeat protein